MELPLERSDVISRTRRSTPLSSKKVS